MTSQVGRNQTSVARKAAALAIFALAWLAQMSQTEAGRKGWGWGWGWGK